MTDSDRATCGEALRKAEDSLANREEEEAEGHLEHALEVARQSGNEVLLVEVLIRRGILEQEISWGGGHGLIEEAEALLDQMEDRQTHAELLEVLADYYLPWTADFVDRAVYLPSVYLQEALEYAEEQGDTSWQVRLLWKEARAWASFAAPLKGKIFEAYQAALTRAEECEEDQAYCDILNDAAHYYRAHDLPAHSDPDLAEKVDGIGAFFRREIEVSEEIDYVEGSIRALAGLADLQEYMAEAGGDEIFRLRRGGASEQDIRVMYLEKAVDLLTQALEIAEEDGEFVAWERRLSMRLGAGHAGLGDDESALAFYNRALELGENDADALETLESMAGRVEPNETSGISRAWYRKLLAAEFEPRHFQRLLGILRDIGKRHWRIEAEEQARQYFARLLELIEKQGFDDPLEHVVQRDVLPKFAKSLWFLGEREEAEEVYRQVLELARESYDTELELHTHVDRGLLRFLDSDWEDAIARFEEAIEFLNERCSGKEATRVRTRVLRHMGISQRQLGHIESAQESLALAVRLAEKYGYEEEQPLNRVELAILHCSLGKHEEGIEQFDLALAGGLPDSHLASVHFQKGMAHCARAEKREAADQIARALILAIEHSASESMLNNFIVVLGSPPEIEAQPFAARELRAEILARVEETASPETGDRIRGLLAGIP